MNFFDDKDLGNYLLQLCPKVVKHPVYPSRKTYVSPVYLSKFIIYSRVVHHVNTAKIKRGFLEKGLRPNLRIYVQQVLKLCFGFIYRNN
jgi:hypothetical protein